MGQLELMPREVILRRDSSISYDPRGKGCSPNAELCLTNEALLVGIKGMFGGIKKTLRFPLSGIVVDNGVPRVCEGRSRDGSRQLHVFFSHGVESFALGEADVEGGDLKSALKSVLTSQSEKEQQNIAQWCQAITMAVRGARSAVCPVAPPPPVASMRVEPAASPIRPAVAPVAKGDCCDEEGGSETLAYQVGSLIATASKGIVGAAAFASERAASAASERSKPAEHVNVTERCIGCGAPLAGFKGQRIVCRYCDTDQTID